MARPELDALTLEAPDRLARGERRADVGATVYRALALLRANGGRVPAQSLCLEVWGVPEVARRTLFSLCHRVGEKLGAVGSPLRCGVDGSDVWLY